MGKCLKKIIFNHIYNHLTTHHLITKNQSGFRPGDSTTNQQIDFVNEIHHAFDNTKSLEVRAIFPDISKAFDKVWHDGLIFKMRQYGYPVGFAADYSTIESGVPQGSVLGPLLFLIYINNLEKNIKSNVNFFADDTMLFSIVNDPLISANELNHDLNIINQWAYQWKVEFNPDPSKQATEVLFSCKQKSTIHPSLFSMVLWCQK